MSTQELKDLLTEIADEVEPASVYRQAVAQARTTARRTALVSGFAALVVAIGGVTAFGLSPDAEDAPPEVVLPAAAATTIDGDFYLVTQPDRLQTRDATETTWSRLLPEAEDPVADSFTISPDGRYAAWFDSDYQPHIRGIADDTAGTEWALADSAQEAPCSAPVWTPDSTQVYLAMWDDISYYWDAETSELTAAEPMAGCDIQTATTVEGEDLRFSVARDGAEVHLLRTDDTGKTTQTPVGEAVRHTGVELTGLTAVSPDGRFACVGVSENGVDRDSPHCQLVVEIDSGLIIELKPDGYGTAAVFDIPGGLLTVEPSGLTLRDFSGAQLDQVPAEYPIDGPHPPFVIAFVPHPTD